MVSIIILAIWLLPALIFTIWFLWNDTEFRSHRTVLNGCDWWIVPMIAIIWPYLIMFAIDEISKEKRK